MSEQLKKKLKLTTNLIDTLHTETSRKTPHMGNEGFFNVPQSPKFSIKVFTDLQDQLRLKEIDLFESIKAKRRLETELSEFKVQFTEKEIEIRRLSEENLNLKAQLRETDYGLTDYWKKEVQRKNEGFRKIQESLKLKEHESKSKANSELKKIIKYFEDDKKYSQKQIESLEKHLQAAFQQIKLYEKENFALKSEKPQGLEISFEKQLKELEALQSSLFQENATLKQELEIIRKGNNLQDLVLLSSDIHKISRQVYHLLTILRNMKQGKDISLYLLLEMEDARVISSSRQLVQDVAQLKKNLNEIKDIVSDYHAEILGGSLCLTQ